MYIIFHTVLYIPKCTLFSLLSVLYIFQSVLYFPFYLNNVHSNVVYTMIRYNHNKHLASLYSQHLCVHVFSCFQGCFFYSLVYYNKPVKLPRTLVHYGKDCTWVWSRVLISHSRAILASRPHPRTIFSVMHLAAIELYIIIVHIYIYSVLFLLYLYICYCIYTITLDKVSLSLICTRQELVAWE